MAIKLMALSVLAALTATLLVGTQQQNEINQADNVAGPLLLARNLQRSGQYNAARNILLDALSKAPNSASLLVQLGSVYQDVGEYLEAERSYLRALNTSWQTEGDPERFVILNNLGTLYVETGQYAKGNGVREQLEHLTPGVLNGHPAAVARLLSVVGSLEQARNRNDLAESYYTRSLQLFQKAKGPVSLDAALVKNDLGGLRLEAGQYESASEFFRQAIRAIETASGRNDPALVHPLLNLARCENMSGHPDEAEPVARRAAELSVKIFGEEHRVTATAILEKASALRRLGRKKPARDLEKRAKAALRNNSTENLAGYTVSLRDLTSAGKQ